MRECAESSRERRRPNEKRDQVAGSGNTTDTYSCCCISYGQTILKSKKVVPGRLCERGASNIRRKSLHVPVAKSAALRPPYSSRAHFSCGLKLSHLGPRRGAAEAQSRWSCGL